MPGCQKKPVSTNADVASSDGNGWFYSDEVKEHFFNPKNFAHEDPKDFDAYGEHGSPACGDIMRVWIKVKDDRITDFKWKTFGCASAIAATSAASEIVTENGGMSLNKAYELKPGTIMERLGGLPARKVHCSVLCDQALKNAIDNYRQKYAQNNH